MSTISTVSVTFPQGTASKTVPLGTELKAFDSIMEEREITDSENQTEEGMFLILTCGTPNLDLRYRFTEGSEIVARTKLKDYLSFRGVDQLGEPEPTPVQDVPAEISVPVEETVQKEEVPVTVEPETATPDAETPIGHVEVVDHVDADGTVHPIVGADGSELSDPKPEIDSENTGTEIGDAPAGTPLDPNTQA